MKQRAEAKKKKRPVAVLCSALGTALLILIVAACVPLTVPRLFGLKIYTVVSGSMEPAIPTGSLVYVKQAEPGQVKAEEVIAFYGVRDTASIITHRVVENRALTGEFITKGDANQTEDMNPVPYENLIGRVVFSIPWLGGAAQAMTGGSGRLAAVLLILAALALHGAAAILGREKGRKSGGETSDKERI